MAVDEDLDIAVLPVPQALAGTPGLKLAEVPPKVGDPVFALGASWAGIHVHKRHRFAVSPQICADRREH